MRVIAGQFGGRTLFPPKGTTTRPTTDRVRESLFSALASLRGGFDDACVLDAFAGSGALGIEALSRGASFVLFCEKDRQALSALARNTSFIDRDCFHIMRGDVFQRALSAPTPFDVVFLDPPYATEATQVAHLLDGLDEAGQLASDAIVSYEHAADNAEALLQVPSRLQWQLVRSKTFGDTAIDFYGRP